MGRDPRELPLAMESLRVWRGFKETAGVETGFRNIGTSYICPDEAALAKREAWLPYAREQGLECHLLTGTEVERLLPGSAVKWAGALYTPGDGVAEPSMAAPAVANAARRMGARVVTGCAVRAVDISAGRVSGVVTEHGRVDCDPWFWQAAPGPGCYAAVGGQASPAQGQSHGAAHHALRRWTGCRGLGAGIGVPAAARRWLYVSDGHVLAEIVPDSFKFLADFLPVLKQEGKEIDLRLTGSFFREFGYLFPGGPESVSPFEKIRALDPRPSRRSVDNAFSNLVATFPVFTSASVADTWAGMIDVMPDLVPVISAIEKYPGLFVSTGYSGHGFGIGPGAGRLTANLVTGCDPGVDPTPFRFSRFTDGTPVGPRASL